MSMQKSWHPSDNTDIMRQEKNVEEYSQALTIVLMTQ